MTKCDFCTQSSPIGKCRYESQGTREDYCDKAIKQMVKTFESRKNDNKRGKPFR